MPRRDLHLEARRRERDPLFGLLTRAAREALARRDVAPFAEGVARAAAPVEAALFAVRLHGVSGLLARLADAAPGALPAELHEALVAERARIGARGERLAADVAELGERAARAGLPYAPLKGAVLAPEKYRDLSLRPAADVDLLATQGSFDAWRLLLAEAGYRETETTFKHVTFVRGEARPPDGFSEHPDGPRPVELHAAIREPFLGRTVDATAAYAASLREGTLHGAPALLPDDDGLLVHLLLHTAPHAVGRGARLVQLQDLSLLVPSRVGARCAGEALGDVAWGTAQLAARGLPGCLPPPFLEALGRWAPPQERRRAWLARPGLRTGEAARTLLVLAELPLCATAGDALRRMAAALPERALLSQLYGEGTSYPVALARWVRDRLA